MDDRGGNKAEYVRRMFASIARRYDLLNSMLSFGRDRSWRNFTMAQIADIPHGMILDLATGTGKIALLAARIFPDSTVIGIDFCPEMLSIARRTLAEAESTPCIPCLVSRKGEHRGLPLQDCSQNRDVANSETDRGWVGERIHLVQGDALRLPFPDDTFDCVTIGFALRNVTSIASLFAEMNRVTKPGGKMVSLELTRPSLGILGPLHKLYIKVVIRLVGGLVSGKWEAYRYLPQSILEFPSPQEVRKVMEDAGWRKVEIHRLTLGVATVQTGIKG